MILKIKKTHENYLNFYLRELSPSTSPVCNFNKEYENFVEYELPDFDKWTGLKTFTQIENEVEEQLKIDNNFELLQNISNLKEKLDKNQQQAKEISFYILNQEEEKLLFTLKSNTNDYKGFLLKIENAIGSIKKYTDGDKEKALKTQNYHIRLENKQTFLIEAVNYLWEYGLEEVLVILENIRLQYETTLEAINQADTLEKLNAIDIEIKNHKNEALQGIKVNLFKVCNHIINNGKTKDGYKDFEDIRWVNEKGIRKQIVLMFPAEIVEEVDKVISTNKLLSPISETLNEDSKNKFSEMINNSFLEI